MELFLIFCTLFAAKYSPRYLGPSEFAPQQSRMMAAEEAMVLPAYVGALDRGRQRETALITGASSGIGLDLAQLMAPDFDLIITARSQAGLEKIAQELQAAHGITCT